jgi:nicotinamide-nucleotide amidase
MSEFTEKYGKFTYCDDKDTDFLDKTADLVVQLLIRRNNTISIAESCTGGMLAQYITSVSGASGVFELGICSYSNRIKISELDVDGGIISRYSEISGECAEAMARGIMKKAASDIGVGITGVAGPGAERGIPAGTVFVSVCGGKNILTYNLKLYEAYENLTRKKVRELSTAYSLKIIEEILRMES